MEGATKAVKELSVEGVPPTGAPAPEKEKSKSALKKEAKEREKRERKEQYAKERANNPKPDAPKATPAPKTEAPAVDPDAMFKQGFLANVYPPPDTCKEIFTRFPPEPNGFLHIGHSKAIAINFGFARYHKGQCYLRYDDTNPEKELEVYFTQIREIVAWLGFKPYEITYSSDHFDRLYELAEDLTKRGKAYVCHCTKEEVNAQRGGANRGPRYACLHRDTPIEENLEKFRAMRDGKYKPKEAQLRMKQKLVREKKEEGQSAEKEALDEKEEKGYGNPQMWDITAYRVLDAEHHRTGPKWKIYPTYDFTHCLVDSFEGITHSLCTTEFINSRESYEWLCHSLSLYTPKQSEYGRLSISGTILSKRKLLKLVEGGYVRGWDDPRLYTLAAVRRRGVPPGAILAFVNDLGVTTAQSSIQVSRFEQSVRTYLENSVPRLMLILDPIPVIIDDLPADYLEEISLPFSPKHPEFGTHTVPFTRKIFIDRSDFREEDSKDYFRLAPGKSVGLLKVPYPIRATAFTKDEVSGLVTEIHAVYERPSEEAPFKKPKTYIQWIGDAPARGSPVGCEVRVFHALFKSARPEVNEEGFLGDVNPRSEEVFPGAIVETGFEEVRRRAPWPEEGGGEGIANKDAGFETVRFQGLRVGYFAMDKDSENGKVVLNRIVSLKEDPGKGV